VRVGAEAGLDATSLKQALDEGRFRARVQEGIDWSRAVGVTAIPTFIFDEKYGVVGAQELPVLRQVLQELGHQPCAPLTE
jgi:predicted DsbA family dithiol-disulfide isomerase